MKIQVHEILLTMKVAKELLRSCPEVAEKLEKLLANEVYTLTEDSCLTVNQLSTHLTITTEELENLFTIARKK